MRYDLTDPFGYTHSIETRNPKLAIEWLDEWLPNMISTSNVHEWRIRVWPITEDEVAVFKSQPVLARVWDWRDMLQLSEAFNRLAGKLKEKEKD